jgi:hypothetical protein
LPAIGNIIYFRSASTGTQFSEQIMMINFISSKLSNFRYGKYLVSCGPPIKDKYKKWMYKPDSSGINTVFCIYVFLFLITFISACQTQRYTPPSVSNTRSEYIATYSDLAIREMKRTGIPASIKMAQAILESGDGNSTLARNGNNHFGIKCHDWRGRTIYHNDDLRNECFRRYSRPEESFLDHSEFLTGRARYANLFKLDPTDYKGWARGLKTSGYATNPNYDNLLISIIEANKLYRLDSGQRITSGNRQATVETVKNRTPVTSAQKREVFLSTNRIRYIIAVEGDNYESLTREKGLMKRELSRYNDIPANSPVNAGDVIYLQPKRNRAERGVEKHIVGNGETMHYISQIYGIKLDRLLRMNSIQPGNEPSTGEIIYLRRGNPGRDINGLKPEYDL